ncbi:hypothetical protein GQ457_09G010570 [Hibiscus cannabinus]
MLDTFLKVFNGVWVNEYNFRGILIHSFDPGENDTAVGSNHDILNAFVSESESDKRFFVFGGCVKLFDDDSTNISELIPLRAENGFKQLKISVKEVEKAVFVLDASGLDEQLSYNIISELIPLRAENEYEKISVKEAEKAVFVLDASGLDEQLSYNRTKTIFPTDTTTCFLQLWIEVILTLERASSRLTQDELAYECITASTVRIRDFGILCTYQRMKLYSYWPVAIKIVQFELQQIRNIMEAQTDRSRSDHGFIVTDLNYLEAINAGTTIIFSYGVVLMKFLMELVTSHMLAKRAMGNVWSNHLKIQSTIVRGSALDSTYFNSCYFLYPWGQGSFGGEGNVMTTSDMKNEAQRGSNQRDNDKEKKSWQ